MKIVEMRPELTAFRDGQHKKASSWEFYDDATVDDMGITIDRRQIWHYDTLMLEFHGFNAVKDEYGGDAGRVWTCRVMSKGRGSVTDQQGINALCSVKYYYGDTGSQMLKDYGYRMFRDKKGGGPRVIYSGHPSGEHQVL